MQQHTTIVFAMAGTQHMAKREKKRDGGGGLASRASRNRAHVTALQRQIGTEGQTKAEIEQPTKQSGGTGKPRTKSDSEAGRERCRKAKA